VNVKSVLKRVYNLASHTSPAKRLGAALIVNRIYRVFREESTLVNQYTMELMYWMLFSLKFAEADPPGLGTRQQTCTAISHLQRIIQVKATLFLKVSNERRRFPGVEETTLEGLVQWLLRETARSEMEYTKMCRSLFDSFVKLLPGKIKFECLWYVLLVSQPRKLTEFPSFFRTQGTPAPGAWIGTNVKENPNFLSAIYSVPEFSSQPIDRPIAFQKWCAQLASTLSNYCWLLGHSESTDRLVVTLVKSSPVLKAAKQFLETCLEFTRAITRGGGSLATMLTAQERRQIMDQNFITVRKLIVFVTLVSSRRLDRGDKALMDHLLSSKILGTLFFEVFATCTFMPDSIGNDELLKSELETKVWRDELETALKVFKQLPEDSLAELGNIMMNTISYNDLVPLAISMDSKGGNKLMMAR